MYIFLSHKTQLQLQLHYSTVGDMQLLFIFICVVIPTKIHVSPQKPAVRHESVEPAYDLW